MHSHTIRIPTNAQNKHWLVLEELPHMSKQCDPYFWESPSILMRTPVFLQCHGEDPLCMSQLVNHITLIYLVALLLSGLVTVLFKEVYSFPIVLLIATVHLLPSFYQMFRVKRRAEGFQAAEAAKEEVKGVYDTIGSIAPASSHPETLPTARNPFMNVLLDEITYAPKRAKAASITDMGTKVALDDFFRTEFYNDPTDVFGKTQSQRQFVTMPSTSIPNDQDSYQNWLYRIPGKTCKEGGREACLPGTDGGALPWLNADR